MPAHRGWMSRKPRASGRARVKVNCSIINFEESPDPPPSSRRVKDPSHIPRPSNAFMLFRSEVIKNQYVTTKVETNHTTLSKIIGLTWRNLSEVERQKWQARAEDVRKQHQERYSGYIYKPKLKNSIQEPRKVRELVPNDHKRYATIAELLACGKTGQKLEEAIQEFDKHHVPQIIARFDTPLTASTFKSKMESPSAAPVLSDVLPPTTCQDIAVIRTDCFTLEDWLTREALDCYVEPDSLDSFIQSTYKEFDASTTAAHEVYTGISNAICSTDTLTLDVQQTFRPMHFPIISSAEDLMKPYNSEEQYPFIDLTTYCEPFTCTLSSPSQQSTISNCFITADAPNIDSELPTASGIALDDDWFNLPPMSLDSSNN